MKVAAVIAALRRPWRQRSNVRRIKGALCVRIARGARTAPPAADALPAVDARLAAVALPAVVARLAAVALHAVVARLAAAASGRTLATLVFACTLVGSIALAQDQLELVDGTRLEGRVVFENDKQIVLRGKAKERVFQLGQLKSIRSLERSLKELLNRAANGLPHEAGERVVLARFAAERGLEGEAAALWWAVLAVDPEQADAHAALQHRAAVSGWQYKSDKGWQPFGSVREARVDWATAWTWRSLHYELRTNTALEAGIDALFDLERLYAAFQSGFGQELELRTVEGRMSAQIHGDTKSYPNPGDGRLAFYDSAQRVLHVAAAQGIALDRLFHEGTHQLLHMTGEYGSKARGVVPAWLHEGLAEYMAAAGKGSAGAAHFVLGARDLSHYAIHAAERQPYDLPRLLAFDTTDFMASSRAGLKYAQAYTLVDFLLHGKDERYRSGWFAFLRSAYAGQSTATDFQAAFAPAKISEKQLEEDWTDWVRGIAR